MILNISSYLLLHSSLSLSIVVFQGFMFLFLLLPLYNLFLSDFIQNHVFNYYQHAYWVTPYRSSEYLSEKQLLSLLLNFSITFWYLNSFVYHTKPSKNVFLLSSPIPYSPSVYQFYYSTSSSLNFYTSMSSNIIFPYEMLPPHKLPAWVAH